jgi:hypothetical protein
MVSNPPSVGTIEKSMQILAEFQIEFTLPEATAMVAVLHLHPSLQPRLCSGNQLLVESIGVPFPLNEVVPATVYIDSLGNRCARFLDPAGHPGFPVRTSSRPNHFPMSNTPVRSRCRLRIFPHRFCGFSCRAGIARLINSTLSPTRQFGSTKRRLGTGGSYPIWVHDKVTFTTTPPDLPRLPRMSSSSGLGCATISNTSPLS